jgi:hypothetical protein
MAPKASRLFPSEQRQPLQARIRFPDVSAFGHFVPDNRPHRHLNPHLNPNKEFDMSTTFDQAFIKQFEREVHEAYQRQGSKLRNAVRISNNVNGSSAVFQKIGKGTASTKSTHGMVPVMNLDHTNVEVTLADYYAGDWVDRLEELKSNINERQVIASAGAYALGRKTDELIITALATASTHTVAEANTGLTKAKILNAFETLGENDVPDDSQRFAVVGWKQWTELLAIPEFVSADYVGDTGLPFGTAMQAKQWLGTIWIPHSGSTDRRQRYPFLLLVPQKCRRPRFGLRHPDGHHMARRPRCTLRQ